MITATTRLLVLLGDPVAHSRSPELHNLAHRSLGLDGVYLALRCGEDALGGLMRGIAAAGGGGNVTVPHKVAASGLLDRWSPEVSETGACNTFWGEGALLVGDNTDVAAFRAEAASLVGEGLAGARVLLLGAGGAARAALCGLRQEGAGEVVILNRSRARAQRLAAPDARTPVTVAAGAAELAGERFDLAVNATPLGLDPDDPLPLAVEDGPALGAGLDLAYRKGGTDWVRALHGAGIPARDGTGMLVGQAAEAFARWWGTDPPLAVMREAIAG